MKFFKSIYFYLLPFLLFFSCMDDGLGIYSQGNYSHGDEDGIEFMVEGSSSRTRSVNFTPGALVKINSVWVGIFDINAQAPDKSYLCVSKNALEQSFIEINSSLEDKNYTNLIRVPLTAPAEEYQGHKFIMISVVNFNGVTDQNGYQLADRLQSIGSWKEFVDIAVDTKTGYSYPHDADSPMMAGFLRTKNDALRQAPHVQVDQFEDNDDVVEKIFPGELLNNSENSDLLFSYDSEKEKYDTSNRSVRLRRLVANINVNIEVVNSDLELTNVTYRRHNMPEAVYIIERRTVKFDTDENGNFYKIVPPSNADQAANYADKVWAKYVVGDSSSSGYTDDVEWQINSNRDSQTGKWSFSFQHFANKHWARNSIDKDRTPGMEIADYNDLYSKREEKQYVNNNSPVDPEARQYYFKTLANNVDDFNNKASYFEVKMHLIDTKTNRCADAVYVIHEGNTSNPDGTEALGGNLDDFTCARNISYNYNIKVAGFNNIFLNVDDNGVNVDYKHHYDQGGTIWQMIYLNDPENKQRHYYMDSEDGSGHFENVLKGSKGDYSHLITTKDENNEDMTGYYTLFEKAISFDPFPNVAFRLYGYTNYRTKYNRNDVLDEAGIAGYNYNFERSSFSNLYGLWPMSAGDYSHYFMDDIALDIHQIPADLRNGILIKESGNDYPMDMIEFVKHATTQTEPKTYDVYIRKTDLASTNEKDKDKYVRAIYIGDRNGIIDPVDKCSRRVNIYCIAQYPDYQGRNYDMIVARDNTSSILPGAGNTQPYLIDNNLSGTFNNTNAHNGKGMIFSSNPDLAYRIMGYDENNNYVDICYNFDINSSTYQNFKDHWPQPSSITQNNVQVQPSNLTTLMNGLKILTSSGSVLPINQLNLNNVYPVGFLVGAYNHTGDISQSIRRLYIFDKKTVENIDGNAVYESTQDDYYYQIYGVSQYPQDNSVKVTFNANPLGHEYLMEKWKDEKNAINAGKGTNYQIYYVDGSSNWTGTIDSFVDMPIVLTHVDWIDSYRFDFKIGSEIIKSIDYSKKDLTLEPDGSYLLRLNTKDWTPGTYDVVVTPIAADPDILYSGNDPVTLRNQLMLRKMEWDLTGTPWSSIYSSMLDHDDLVLNWENYGTEASPKMYFKQRNFFFKFYGMEMGVYTFKDNIFGKNPADTDEKFLGTYQDVDPVSEGVPDGPTEGRPYQFKFTTLKNGTLKVDATQTNATNNEKRGFYVKIGNQKTEENPKAYTKLPLAGNHSPKEIPVTGVDTTNGTEILIYAPVSDSEINGTIRMYKFSFE